MNFLKESHRKYQYEVHPAILHVDSKIGVSITEGIAYFDKRFFDGKDSCEEWLKNFAEGTMKLDKKSPIDKMLYGIKAAPGVANDQEWEAIKALMTEPDDFTRDDVVVYHPYLAHNVVDRDRQRFVLSLLKDFERTIVDKPLLIGHSGSGRYRSPGEGRFFSAEVAQVGIDEMLKVISPHPVKNIRDQLVEIEQKDSGLFILKASIYLIKLDSNADFRKKISAGIVKDVSIQFRAGALNTVTDKDNDFKYQEYTGPGEALEGSFVWLGSQYGMQNKKDYTLVPNAEELANSEELENTQTGDITMEISFKTLEIESMEFTEDGIKNVQKAVDDKVKSMKDENETLKTQNEELTTEKAATQADVDLLSEIKSVLGEDLTKEKVESMLEESKAQKAKLIKETVAVAVNIGAIENTPEIVAAKELELGELSFKAIESKQDEYEKIAKKSGVIKSQIPDGEEPAKKTMTVNLNVIR